MASFFVPPASAGAVAGRADLAIAGNDGYLGRGVIDPAPDPEQLAERAIRPGRSTGFVVELRNLGAADTFTVLGSGDADGFGVRYLDGDGIDVTTEVTAGTYSVSLDAGRRSPLLVRIVAPAEGSVDVGARHTVWLRASEADSGRSDLVRARVEVPPLRLWSSSFDGRLRCTATFPHRIWQPGRFTNVEVRLTNLTGHHLSFTRPAASLVFRDEAGRRLGDTLPPPFPGPFPGTVELAPGESTRVDLWKTRLRWSGPLSVTVRCGGGRFSMPPATIHVAVPTPQPSVAAAIDAAVGAPGSPWQVCHPGPNGEPATGIFQTPDGRDLPPLTVLCWATVRTEDGFHVVSLHLVSPDDAPGYVLGETNPFRIDPEPPDDAPNFLAVRWGFVVTADDVRPYSSVTQVKALGSGRSVSYTLNPQGVWKVGGGGTCGFHGYAWWYSGDGLSIDWITACTPVAVAQGHERVGNLETVFGRGPVIAMRRELRAR